jgi:hypothetical protein
MSKRGGGLHIDTSAFQRQAKALGAAADQLPYIASNSLNDGVFVARRALVQKVWPASVEVRNRTFLTSALEVKKASKTDLSVELKDKHGRGNLLQHAEGGVAKPKKAQRLAVPASPKIKRGPRGVVKSMLSRALIARTPDRALRVTSRGLFIAVNGKLELMFAFVKSYMLQEDVPFYQSFAMNVRRTVEETLPKNVARAMKTREAR